MDFLYKHRVKATVNAMAPLIVPESIEVQASIFSQKNHGHRFLGDRKGILLIDFLERGLTINADAYCKTVRKLRRAIQNKRRGMLFSGIVLLHDNVRPHTAAQIAQLL